MLNPEKKKQLERSGGDVNSRSSDESQNVASSDILWPKCLAHMPHFCIAFKIFPVVSEADLFWIGMRHIFDGY